MERKFGGEDLADPQAREGKDTAASFFLKNWERDRGIRSGMAEEVWICHQCSRCPRRSSPWLNKVSLLVLGSRIKHHVEREKENRMYSLWDPQGAQPGFKRGCSLDEPVV